MTDPQPPIPASEPPRPVVVNTQDSDLLRNVHEAVTNLGNKLGALPESIVHSFREATNTPPAQPSAPVQPSVTAQPVVEPTEKKHWASRHWFR